MSPITATPSTAASARAAMALGERFRAQLADAVGAHRFGLWFEHGTTIEITEKSAVIRAANSYVHEWIVRHFGPQLAAVTRAVLGEDAWRLRIAQSGAPTAAPAPREAPGGCRGRPIVRCGSTERAKLQRTSAIGGLNEAAPRQLR